MTDTPQTHLKALGQSATDNPESYGYREVTPDLLETFRCPSGKGTIVVDIEVPEFTCLCPITGQPDFATIHITYIPKSSCVESKSLKLYIGSFREVGTFHEAVVCRIGDDLVALLDPAELHVKGDFAPRGGIPFRPSYVYKEPV